MALSRASLVAQMVKNLPAMQEMYDIESSLFFFNIKELIVKNILGDANINGRP